MYIEDDLLNKSEILTLKLKKLYKTEGYELFKMSKFEEYDLYAENKDFLLSDDVLTFTDRSGRLLALKPDVTLSIIRNSNDPLKEVKKVFYNENVYRPDKDGTSFKEILQTGLECFGPIAEADILQVLQLGVESLKQIDDKGVLMLADLTIIEELLNEEGNALPLLKKLLKAISDRNHDELKELFRKSEQPAKNLELLEKLLNVHGRLNEVEEEFDEVLKELAFSKEAQTFGRIIEELKKSEAADNIGIDFSLSGDINYYNGIIFKAYVSQIPEAVISGGQYDRLMKKLKRKAKAIGFAVYTGLLEERSEPQDDEYLNVALPKGRLGEKVYQLFAKAGYDCPELLQDNRRLLFENQEKKVRYFWVKPADVPIYVERGVADIGVAGKDILLEKGVDVYELLDLKTGICKMAVAARKDYQDDPAETLKVATKFPHIAREYYQAKGRDIDIIKLNGSIEIAPLLGLTDVIVDIVETGRTLKENDLQVIEAFLDISARLIGNRSAYAFKAKMINRLLSSISESVRRES